MPPFAPFKPLNRPRTKLLLDMTKSSEYDATHFNPFLGIDGEITVSGDGLEINTAEFTQTEPLGPRGSLDRYKCAPFYNRLIDFDRCDETIIQFTVAAAQIFPPQPFPRSYYDGINNMTGDARLAHGFTGFFDPRSGFHVYLLGTNDRWIVNVGRDENLAGCTYYGRGSDTCTPCASRADVRFDCNNFMQDDTYRRFKQTMLPEDFYRFAIYRRWSLYAANNNIDQFDWKMFDLWKGEFPEQCAPLMQPDFVAWKSTDNYNDYRILPNFALWYVQYKQNYRQDRLPVSGSGGCSGGVCTSKLFGSRPGCNMCSTSAENPTCCHKYTTGKNCYEKDPSVPGKTTLPYEFSATRSCRCSRIASWEDLIPVARTEACDPSCDFVTFGIGVVRGPTTSINVYLNGQLVYNVPSAGRRGPEKYRAVERGGYGTDLDIASCLLTWGTGTLVDFAVPAENLLALTPTMPHNDYYQVQKDRFGQLKPVVPEKFFLKPKGSPDARVWGQGAVLRLRYIAVMTRNFVDAMGYQQPIDWTKSECCGMNNCSSDGLSGCMTGTCDVTADELFDYLDLENRYDVMFVQPPKPAAGDDMFVPGVYDDGACGGDTCIRARLKRVSKGAVWDNRSCGTTFIGIDPYM